MAGTHRVPSIRRLGSWAQRRALGFGNAAQERIVDQRLGQLDYTAADYAPDEYSPVSSPFYSNSPVSAVSALSSPGGLTPTEAALISQGITTAGKVGTQAIIGTPTLTYNPATGQYTATGGATLPATTALTSELTSYLPLLLLGGAAILLFSMVGRK
jgi:hypothetical protein